MEEGELDYYCEEGWNEEDIYEEDQDPDPDGDEEEPAVQGLFGKELAAIIKFEKDRKRYAREAVAKGEMTSAEAHHFLEHELKNLSGVDKMVAEAEEKIKEEHAEIDRQLESGEIDCLGAELRHEQVLAKEARIRHRLGLLSVGLSYEAIGDLSDDWTHVVQDAYDSEGRELRKDIREKMKNLSPYEKKKLLDNLLEDGDVSDEDYNQLYLDFM